MRLEIGLQIIWWTSGIDISKRKMAAPPSVCPEQSEMLRKGQTPEKTISRNYLYLIFVLPNKWFAQTQPVSGLPSPLQSPLTPRLPRDAPGCYNSLNARDLINVHILFK